LPLLAPELLIPIIVNWWSRFTRFKVVDLGMHHNAEIAPTLILATTYGWLRFKKVIVSIGKNFKNLKMFGRKYLNILLFRLSLFLFFLSTQIFKSPALLFTNKAFYKHTENFEFLNELVKAVSTDGVVMAQTNLAAKLAHRKFIC